MPVYNEAATVEKIIETFNVNLKINVNNDIQIKSADKIRLEKNTAENNKISSTYEYILLETINKNLISKKNKDNKQFALSYFTLYKLLKNNKEILEKYQNIWHYIHID
jgi:hypothetical protein